MRWIGLSVLALICVAFAGSGERPVTGGGGQADGFQAERPSREAGRFSRELSVLLLEQRFRYDARALNEALKRDPGLRYQGYFMDAQEGWTQPTSAHDREIKPMKAPFFKDGVIEKKEDFKALGYNVIILGDVNAEDKRFKAEYWEWLEEWVREGGGLVLISGAQYNPSKYEHESFRKLLPVTLPEEAAEVDTRSMKYWGLTADGASHAVCKLAEGERNAQLWGGEKDGKFERGQLNGLYWHVAGAKPREGTTVLARVALLSVAIAERNPVLAIRQHGEGRVVWVGSDDTWLWREMAGDTYFYRFWQNALGWAADAIPAE